MKKLLIPLVLTVIVAGSTAFGQGYMLFGGGIRTVWDSTDYLSPGPLTDSGFDTTFLWSATATTSPMFPASTPTNSTVDFSFAAAWAEIEGASSSGWTNATTGGAGVVGAPSNNTGSFTSEGGNAFALDGSAGSGQVIDLFVVGWETDGGLYTSLAAAEAGGAAVGWSSVFQYTLGSGPPASPPAETVVPHFGIGTPEPTTVALAGLGAISMIFVRRKRGNETLTKIEPRQTRDRRI